MKPDDIVEFKLNKQLVYIKDLGKGGTGEVCLFRDKEIDKFFAIKKFTPPENHLDDYFDRFKNEIKILIDLFHPNIVRFYTYYLYPSVKFGYLQMEYIEGITIDKYLEENPQMFAKMFMSALNAFEYLEDKGVLHRDIRPSNFLVAENELKIIDFGFSKSISEETISKEFLRLNWPVTVPPEEIEQGEDYSFITEIYYLGSMFKRLLKGNESIYSSIIDRMCEISKGKRYDSFAKVKMDAINLVYYSNRFSDECKLRYNKFADGLCECIANTVNKIIFNDDEIIIERLEKNVNNNSLEAYISNNARLISCFIDSKFKYYKEKKIKTETVENFYRWVVSESSERRAIIFANLKNRILNIDNEPDFTDDLPF